MTVCRGCAGLMEDTGEDWGVCQTCNPTAPVRTQISIRISPKDNDLLKSLSVKLQCSQAEVVSRALNILQQGNNVDDLSLAEIDATIAQLDAMKSVCPSCRRVFSLDLKPFGDLCLSCQKKIPTHPAMTATQVLEMQEKPRIKQWPDKSIVIRKCYQRHSEHLKDCLNYNNMSEVCRKCPCRRGETE